MKRKRETLSPAGRKAKSAMRRAVRRVIAESFRSGVGVALWRDGRVVILHRPGPGSRAA